MKEKTIFVGIDVSKLTLDICLKSLTNESHLTINNSKQAINSFLMDLTINYPQHKIMAGIENTGLYNWCFYDECQSFKIDLFVLHPLHLKRSLGMIRGKSDKIDANRIACYIELHYKQLKPYIIPEKSILKMKLLVTQRVRLVKQKSAIKTSEKELQAAGIKSITITIKKLNKQLINQIDKAIKQIELAISKIIDVDLELNGTYKLIKSVPGVGKVLAWELLIKTNGFKILNNPRKLACYAGVVPFDFSSGTSIYKKPRTSVLADRKLKKLLHMASLRVIQMDGELKAYYERKVKEGKNKMAVINALRNKIIARVCATVKTKEKYKDYSLHLS